MTWVAVGVGVAGVASTAISSSKGSQSSSNNAQSSEEQSAENDALAKAQTIAGTGYTPYTGQVVANESTNEQQGTAMASPDSANNQKASSLYDQAAGDIAGVKQYNSDTLKQYMDPYVSATLTPQLNQENINYDTQKSALLNSKAGAFGGDRSALEENQLDRTHSQTIASDVGNAYSAAYTNAQTAFFQDQNKQINAANALDQVGGDVSKLNTQQIQDLMATGGLQRALSQQQLDFNLNTFTQARDWSTTQLQPLLQAISASKGGNVTTTNTGPASSAAGEAIGGAATIAGAYFTGKGSSTSNSGDDSNTVHGTASDADVTQASNDYLNMGNVGDAASDRRLKTDIQQVGWLPSGLPIYRFRYWNNLTQRYVGVMADEAQRFFPEAVSEDQNGFKRVNYARIH